MRLFLAIVPPPERRYELQAWQELILPKQESKPDRLSWDSKEGKLVTPSVNWRPASAEQMHLTLQFLGDELNVHQKEQIRQALMPVCGRHAPFDMEAGGLGAFPNEERASVLWAGLQSTGLRALTEDIEATLAQTGVKRDKPFLPHITLARSRVPQDVRAILKPWSSKKWGEYAWHVDEFVLFESRHELGGREHHIVERYKLSQTPSA